jgi:hypothetical protein
MNTENSNGNHSKNDLNDLREEIYLIHFLKASRANMRQIQRTLIKAFLDIQPDGTIRDFGRFHQQAMRGIRG